MILEGSLRFFLRALTIPGSPLESRWRARRRVLRGWLFAMIIDQRSQLAHFRRREMTPAADLEIAQLMGIDHHRIFSLAMAIALVVATISALYLGIRANFEQTVGQARLL